MVFHLARWYESFYNTTHYLIQKVQWQNISESDVSHSLLNVHFCDLQALSLFYIPINSGRIWLILAYIFGDFIIIFFNFLFPSDNGNYLSMIPIHSSASSTAMLTQNTLTEQACKCHGHPIDLVTPNKAKWTCPITNRQLAASDVTATAVRIG